MSGILVIAHLTLHEARRRRIFLASLLCGVAFLVLFAIGFHFMRRDLDGQSIVSAAQRRVMLNFMVMAGLYAINFLTVMTAILLPVDTLSGEIASGVMQTIAAKPVRRSAIVLGKWLAYAVILVGYLLFMAGGVLLIGRVIGSFIPPGVTRGLPLMALEGLVVMTLAIAGGTRFSTITNGIVVLGLYGLAFVGSWVEQIGALAGNDAARHIGIAASLVMPCEALWQLAAHHMQPAFMRELHLTPFSGASVPSAAMVFWAVGYALVALLLGLKQFRERVL